MNAIRNVRVESRDFLFDSPQHGNVIFDHSFATFRDSPFPIEVPRCPYNVILFGVSTVGTLLSMNLFFQRWLFFIINGAMPCRSQRCQVERILRLVRLILHMEIKKVFRPVLL